MKRKMLIGITGATGGLGRRLVEYFAEKNILLRVLVRNREKSKNLFDSNIEIVQGNLIDTDSLERFVDGLDICIHLAAQVGKAAKKELINSNVIGTNNLCRAIEQFSPSCRLIYCSSIVVKNYRFYKRPFLSDYTISKCEAEKIVKKYEKKIKITIIYPGYIYGGYDKNFLPQIMQMLKYPIPFLIKGGEKNAPIIYVDDLCELFYLSAINDISIGKKYVSLEKSSMGMHDVIRLVASEKGLTCPDKIYPRLPLVILVKFNSILHNLFGVKKLALNMRVINGLSARGKYFNNAKNDLNWEQRVSISDGISRAIKDYEREWEE